MWKSYRDLVSFAQNRIGQGFRKKKKEKKKVKLLSFPPRTRTQRADVRNEKTKGEKAIPQTLNNSPVCVCDYHAEDGGVEFIVVLARARVEEERLLHIGAVHNHLVGQLDLACQRESRRSDRKVKNVFFGHPGCISLAFLPLFFWRLNDPEKHSNTKRDE